MVAADVVGNVANYLKVPRLESIRSRILALAVLGTVIPAGIALGVAYSQNRRAREEKITEELRSQSTQTARAMGVWLKERLYDLRVFAGSDEVSNNLERFASSSIVSARLQEYLRSLHERFPDFERLIVVNPDGRVLASSDASVRQIELPGEWQKTLRQTNQLIGLPSWDSAAGAGKLIVAVPVQRADGRLLGAFTAELHLGAIQSQLRSLASDSAVIVYLATSEGAMIASSREISAALLRRRLSPGTLEQLTRHEHSAVTYPAAVANSGEAIGALERVPQVPWVVLAETPVARAFQDVRRFRNIALLVVFLLLVVVGSTAYALGLYIVRPLERLAEGAADVAKGDLQVDLPATGGGEVGALTGIFNDMVKRLREGRVELERLSTTDGLTSLTNRRALIQRLYDEAKRSLRTKQPFSVLMVDVDHFKSYNDSFGHQAGDEVLRRVAIVLRDSTRGIDCVGRYGGEEFAVLLPETPTAGALEVAERIRSRMESEEFLERAMAVSIGVAEYPSHGDSAEDVVGAADAALYAAKRAGRNCVKISGATENGSDPTVPEQAAKPAAVAKPRAKVTAAKTAAAKPRKKKS
jgi:diguanylate cyclase (GGDEF)-like protein